MKMKRFFAASVFAALVMTGLSAQASTITYAYDGTVRTCHVNPAIGICGSTLDVDDAIGGFLEIDEAAIVPGGQVGSGDIVSYSFDFGVDLSFNSGNSTITQSFISVDAGGELDAGALVLSSTMVLPGIGSEMLTLNFGAASWEIIATIDGVDTLVASGVGKITAVPVPGALFLFGPALLGFLGLRRRAA